MCGWLGFNYAVVNLIEWKKRIYIKLWTWSTSEKIRNIIGKWVGKSVSTNRGGLT
jgi:hypothetical protein